MSKIFLFALCAFSFNLQSEDLNFQINSTHFVENSWWPWPANENDNQAQPSQNPIHKYFKFDHLLKLEQILEKKILGQREAVKITADSIVSYYAGINDPDRPIATLLFFGPTGVGKTELVKALAEEILVNPSTQFIHINMSEFVTEEGVYRLIGLPYGIVGHEKGGELSNAIIANPFSIILLDEFEKAYPPVKKLFLQILDEGHFKTSTGEKVNCTNCIIIATSNLGAEAADYVEDLGYEEAKQLAEPILIKGLSPELYNRLEPVLFTQLSLEVLKGIIDNKLELLANRVYCKNGVILDFADSVKQYLEIYGYRPKLGARPVNRLISKEIAPSIGKALIRDKYKDGDHMYISFESNHVVVTKI